MTSKSMTQLGTLALSGADVRTYLQGQLTVDMDELEPTRVRLAACNSPQGRVQAVLWIVERSDGIVLILPETMIESTAARLRKYVLRSRVTFQMRPLHVEFAALPSQLASLASGPASAEGAPGKRTHIEHEAISYVRLPGLESWLKLAGGGIAPDETDAAMSPDGRLAYLRAGLPQVYPQTHEAFVAQMLNLDLLDAISFSKGCYTGQEIIARAHYRGAVKRRMFRFRASCPPPDPGTRILAGASHAGDVVDAAAAGDGCELLAVISLAQLEQTLHLEGESAVPLERMTLPYPVARPAS